MTRLFVGAGATAAIAYPVKLAANLETAQAQFTALTKSADSAGKIISELEQFAPLALIPVDELQRSAQTLLGYGQATDQVVPSVRALSEIARGNAERFKLLTLAFGQTTAKTRLYAAEVRQFVESGWNPLQQIAEKTGETMAEVSARLEAGGISAQEVTSAMQEAVGPTGRFHGLLEQMGKTAAGAFARLKTGAMLAIRPLGEALLPSIKGILASLNEWMPAFAEIIKANASFALTIGAGVVGVLGFAAAVTSLGLSIQITGFAVGGIVSALGLLLNPITLAIGAVAGLAYWFATSTKWGNQMVASLAGAFTQLKDIAVETFGGIADSLAAGNFSLAAKVAWAGLKLIWLEGTQWLRQKWSDFKDFYLRTTTEAVFGAMRIWTMLKTKAVELWTQMETQAKSIGEAIGHWLTRSSDPSLAADQDRAHMSAMDHIQRGGQARLSQIVADEKKALEKIEAARATAQGTRDAEYNKEIEQRKKNLEAAKAELAALREKAAQEKKDKEDPPKFTPEEFKVPGLDSALDNKSARGTFSADAVIALQGGGGFEEETAKNTKETVKKLAEIQQSFAQGLLLTAQ